MDQLLIQLNGCINESMQEILGYILAFLLQLLHQCVLSPPPHLWMTPFVEVMLNDFVNDLMWKGIMNTFDDIGRYQKSRHKDSRPSLMMALIRCKNKTLYTEETKKTLYK